MDKRVSCISNINQEHDVYSTDAMQSRRRSLSLQWKIENKTHRSKKQLKPTKINTQTSLRRQNCIEKMKIISRLIGYVNSDCDYLSISIHIESYSTASTDEHPNYQQKCDFSWTLILLQFGCESNTVRVIVAIFQATEKSNGNYNGEAYDNSVCHVIDAFESICIWWFDISSWQN